MLPPFTGDHGQAREADCEPANRACVTTTHQYCRACPRSWPRWLLLTKRLERRCMLRIRPGDVRSASVQPLR
jgi:hypothetical protein